MADAGEGLANAEGNHAGMGVREELGELLGCPDADFDGRRFGIFDVRPFVPIQRHGADGFGVVDEFERGGAVVAAVN